MEHDVLKVLFESAIPAQTCKNYTPDWLAHGVVATTVTDPLRERVLDPFIMRKSGVSRDTDAATQPDRGDYGWQERRD